MQALRLQRQLLLSNNDFDEDWYIDGTPYFHRGYRRPELVEDDEEELSDYVNLRLYIARMKALEAARKMRG